MIVESLLRPNLAAKEKQRSQITNSSIAYYCSRFLLEFNHEKNILKFHAQWKSSPGIVAENSFSAMIQAIETLLENYYAREEQQVKRWIVCSHCLSLHKKSKFSYEDAVRAMTTTASLNCPSCQKSIRIDFIAPDIAVAGSPVIHAKDLVIGEQIGTGGFGGTHECLKKEHIIPINGDYRREEEFFPPIISIDRNYMVFSF